MVKRLQTAQGNPNSVGATVVAIAFVFCYEYCWGLGLRALMRTAADDIELKNLPLEASRPRTSACGGTTTPDSSLRPRPAEVNPCLPGLTYSLQTINEHYLSSCHDWSVCHRHSVFPMLERTGLETFTSITSLRTTEFCITHRLLRSSFLWFILRIL